MKTENKCTNFLKEVLLNLYQEQEKYDSYEVLIKIELIKKLLKEQEK